MVQRWSALIGCAALLALGSPAVSNAATTQPTELAGISIARVTAHRGMAAYEVRFADRAAFVYRHRIAGSRVRIGCSTLRADGVWATVEEATARTFRAPRRRSTLRLEVERGFRADSCFLAPAQGSALDLPVTALGRRYRDEQGAFVQLVATGFFATKASGKPATVAEAVSAGHGVLVALTGPDAAPPAGVGGYWTDGRRSVLASVTATGQRMFLDTGPDGVVRTNILDFLQADDDACSEGAAIGRRDETVSCGPAIVLGGAG